ncbi:cathepsin L-like [Drosophila hydei]|uniref:cathepsin L n=1 Tax=Drosophila hydei TaxID=7224 RepID=A0A6J1MGQ1_DROHY|nr:cathepsin L-like [Drosophila hydei]
MKSVVFLLIALVVASNQTLNYEDVLAAEFEFFKMDYEKSYENSYEEKLRSQIFKRNKETIDEHNARYARGEETYMMGINQFSDMLAEEFQEMMLSNVNTSEFASSIDFIYAPHNIDIPHEIDWRAKGAVTAVKNQGECRSCWAFSATGALEGQHFIRTKQLIPLSEQNLMDCSARYQNYGCRGGWPSHALKYVEDNRGLDNDQAYPYEGHVGECRFRRSSIGATVSRVAQVRRDENALAQVVAEKGPVSVAVDARRLQHYRSGVFNDPICGDPVNHAMLAVGYGHDQRGGDFWLLKNSWGRWGEEGYMRLARNHGNMCQVASYAILPIV